MNWDEGLTLHQAKFRYGERELVERYRQIQQADPRTALLQVLSDQIEAITKPKTNPAETILQDPRFQAASKLSKEENDIDRQLDARIVGFLKAGQLVGLGYALPRAPDAMPVRIPSDVWAGRIHWKDDKVEGNGLAFIAVRIVRPIAAAPTQKALRAPEPTKGRPSRRDQLEAAFHALDDEGRIPNHPDNKKALFNALLDKLDELYPEQAGDRRGLSDKTLYKLVSDLIEAKHLNSKN